MQRITNFLRFTSSDAITWISGWISGSPPAIDTIGAPALLDRRDGLRHRHALLQRGLRVLDLAAARALEVALEERLELDEQRELLRAGQALLHQVRADAHGLPQGHGHVSPRLLGSAIAIPSRLDKAPAACPRARYALIPPRTVPTRTVRRDGVSTTARSAANGRPAAADASQADSMSTAIAPPAASSPRSARARSARPTAAGPGVPVSRRAPAPRPRPRRRRRRTRRSRPQLVRHHHGAGLELRVEGAAEAQHGHRAGGPAAGHERRPRWPCGGRRRCAARWRAVRRGGRRGTRYAGARARAGRGSLMASLPRASGRAPTPGRPAGRGGS